MTKPAKILVAADVPGAKPDSETNHKVGPPPLDCETHRLVPKHREKAFPSVSAVWAFGTWKRGPQLLLLRLLTPLELLEDLGVDEWATARFLHSKVRGIRSLDSWMGKTQVIQWAKPLFFSVVLPLKKTPGSNSESPWKCHFRSFPGEPSCKFHKTFM